MSARDGADRRELLSIPLGDGRQVDIRLPRPMSEVEWALMRNVLDAMKPGIVEMDTRRKVVEQTMAEPGWREIVAEPEDG